MPKKRRGGSVGRKSSQAAIKKASRSQETGETLGDSAGSEIYTTKKKLDKKSEIHNAETIYKCDTCGMIFSTASNLKRHQNVHISEKSFLN